METNVIQLRETCHSEAVTDVTAVGIRIQNVRENGLPRQSADWLAMTKPLTEWHWLFDFNVRKSKDVRQQNAGRLSLSKKRTSVNFTYYTLATATSVRGEIQP